MSFYIGESIFVRHAKSTLVAGVILVIAAAAFTVPHSAASTYDGLHRFKGPDGSMPQAGLIFDASGNIYGTTSTGGAHGMGTVFQLAPNPDGSWTERVLHSFNGLDGWYPFRGSLNFDGAGNLYGTTSLGGPHENDSGVVFKLTANADGSWTESVLHAFTGGGGDGAGPIGGLTFDGAGNLYGTAGGGVNASGVVFKLTANASGSWTESILYTFTGGHDGGGPEAALIFDSAGNLYGTATIGGLGFGGVVFRLTPQPDGSWTETVLHNFFAGAGGSVPRGGLVYDQTGNLYGTTAAGGTQGFGIVFKLVANVDGTWTERVLHSFTGSVDGSEPYAGLVFDTAGNLYGTTTAGGSANLGVVFKMTPNADGTWAYKGLHAFQGTPGGFPYGAPALDKAGSLYGTTWECGARIPACHGIVFKITP
jgi:uncharacterized repeat protein (TIGR03803 family)